MKESENQIESESNAVEPQKIMNHEGYQIIHRHEELLNEMYENFLASGIKTHFIVSVKFIQEWQAYCISKQFETHSKPPIIEDEIFQQGKLKQGLKYKINYQIINEAIYGLFKPFVNEQNQNKRLVKWQKDTKTNQITPFFIVQCNYLILNELILRKIDCGQIDDDDWAYKTLNLKETSHLQIMLAQIQHNQKFERHSSYLALWHRQSETQISKIYSFIRTILVGLSFKQYTILNIGKEIKNLDIPLYDFPTTNSKIFFIIQQVPQNGKPILIENFDGQCKGCKKIKFLQVECPCRKIRYCSEDCLKKDKASHEPNCSYAQEIEFNKKVTMFQNQKSRHGSVGLKNLGNTCYMNSCLQCLSNTIPLEQYFMNQHFQAEINKKNILGTKGRLAKCYAKFIRAMWCESQSVFSPKDLKDIISKKNQMFSGYAQHDAQEFFSFLIDGLHEDLNRIEDKYSIQIEEDINKSEVQLAKNSWKMYLKRNQSIITDLMIGQYRSILKCPDCKQKSIKFETFNTVTLPIPLESSRTFFMIHQNQYKKNLKCYFKYRNYDANEWIRNACQTIGTKHFQRYSLYVVTQKDSIYKIGRDSMEQIANKVENENKNLFLIEKTDQQMSIPKDYLLEFTINMIQPQNDKKQLYFKFPMLFDRRNIKGYHISKRVLKYIFSQAYNSKYGPSISNAETKQYEKYEQAMIKKQLFKVYLKWNKTIEKTYKKPKIIFGQEIEITQLISVNDILKKLNTIASNCEIQIRFLPPQKTTEFTFHFMKKYEELGTPPHIPQNQQIPLKSCLQAFSQPQILEGGNEWYCPCCKSLKKAIKQINIYRAPQILVIQLKRFKQRGSKKQKINALVKFPTELDLSKYLLDHRPIQSYKQELQRDGYIKSKSPSLKYIPFNTKSKPTYELYAVSNHMGDLGGGHYTAFAKNNNRWLKYDDAQVLQVKNPSQIITTNAFLLFYQRTQK